jgi:Sulfotransferase family
MAADEHPMPLIFVVGTGRCGSTMLSRLLREHPDVLSISEFFLTLSTDKLQILNQPPVDGAELWRLFSTPQPEMDELWATGTLPELCYPRDHRFNADTGVPPICHTALPMLSDDPDALFDLLAEEIPTWPRRSGADQCRALFGFLGERLGKPIAVERTGGSVTMVKVLREQFPEARFVHIHRSGPDYAVSMTRHLRALLLALDLTAGPRPGGNVRIPAELRRLVANPSDVERLIASPIPLTYFARTWSQMITAGLPALADLPRGCWTSVRYESVLADPAAELPRLADFIGFTSTPQWLAAATALISGPRTAKIAAELPPATMAAVREACAPGAAAIAAAESRLLEATAN